MEGEEDATTRAARLAQYSDLRKKQQEEVREKRNEEADSRFNVAIDEIRKKQVRFKSLLTETQQLAIRHHARPV